MVLPAFVLHPGFISCLRPVRGIDFAVLPEGTQRLAAACGVDADGRSLAAEFSPVTPTPAGALAPVMNAGVIAVPVILDLDPAPGYAIASAIADAGFGTV